MKEENIKSKNQKLVEGVDYYFEGGLMVLSERFLKNRGYCCNNGCRHCPYKNAKYKKGTNQSK